MNRERLTFPFGGEAMVALAGRGLWWPTQRALLIADPHLGKAAAFRSSGIGVPETTAADLERLAGLMAASGAGHLYVLGDLLHAASGRAPAVLDEVGAWRKKHDIPVTVIRGNHDRSASDPPSEWQMDVVDGPVALGALWLAHDPEELCERVGIAGHIHPAICISDTGQTVRFACFHVSERRLVLPAFGSFTGGHTVALRPQQRAIIEADGALLQIVK